MSARLLGISQQRGAFSFLLAVLIDALGTGLFGPFALLYFQHVAGLTLSQVGIFLTAAGLCTLPIIVLTGALVDRFGARRLVVGALVLQGAAFAGYLAVTNAVLLVAMAFVAIVGQRVFWSAYFTLASEFGAAEGRDRWFGALGAAQTVGIGLGSGLAGLLISAVGPAGYRPLVLVNALSFLVAGALVAHGAPARRIPPPTSPQGYRAVLADGPFLSLIGINSGMAICLSLLGTGLPVYLIEGLRAPVWSVGLALALNTALIAGLLPVMVRVLAPLQRTRALVFAGGMLIGWCLLSLLAPRVPFSLLVPFVLLTTCVHAVAEATHAPISNALAVEASPEKLRGHYLAVFQYSWAIATIVTPGFFTTLFSVDRVLPWVMAAMLAALASSGLVLIEGRLGTGSVR